MPCLKMRALLLAALVGMAVSAGSERAFAQSPPSTDAPEQAVPQGGAPGDDATGADETTPLPPSEHKGVIEPPDIGDEGIHTDVPNPDAGHPEEVIPPSEVPEQAPESENR